MNHPSNNAIAPTEREYQELVRRCHDLISTISRRPGAVKLLKGILPTLEQFAAYKVNRA